MPLFLQVLAMKRTQNNRIYLRFVLVIASLVFGALLSEISLRMVYSRLPSIVALSEVEYELLSKNRQDMEDLAGPLESLHCNGSVLLGRSEGSPAKPTAKDFRLAVVGDSVVAGVGAEPGHGVADLLSSKLQQRTGRSTELVQLGLPGGDICDVVGMARSELVHRVDAMVLVLFADDLQNYKMMNFNSKLIAFPEKISGWFPRVLATNSYLANFVWLATLPYTQSSWRTSGDFSRLFVELVESLVARAKAQNTPLVVALLAPAGLPYCPRHSPSESFCGWMKRDMDLMARLLDALGMPYVDLRTIWDDRPPLYDKEEEGAFHGPAVGGMAIHPSTKGHEVLADAIMPALLKALGSPKP